MKQRVIIISGPTAVGKSQVAISLAQEIKKRNFSPAIINFDSLQFYRELIIGTARPQMIEMGGIDHHLFGNLSIKNPISAADFKKMAEAVLEQCFKRHEIAFLVGGSGFYLQALMKGMFDSIHVPDEIRKRSDELYKNKGIDPFISILKEHDYSMFERLHQNDHYRIKRAVEHYWSTGNAFSIAKKDLENRPENISVFFQNCEFFHLYLDVNKIKHAQIIEDRTKKMLENGLIEEVRNLLERGFTGCERPLQSVGYKQVVEYLQRDGKNINELCESICLATRQLAKAQRTWFKRIEDKMIFNPLEDKDKMTSAVLNFCQTKMDFNYD